MTLSSRQDDRRAETRHYEERQVDFLLKLEVKFHRREVQEAERHKANMERERERDRERQRDREREIGRAHV